ncbi:MAG: helix-hairpin-helix domain-containing protein [Verrucomicrobiales bacterium]|jgi:DNA uptake protein ComE-like DNA-binding protein
MNMLANIHYTAIMAIAIAGFPVNSDAAAKKTTIPVSVKPKSAKQAPPPGDHQLVAKKAAAKLTPTQKAKMLTLLNEGSVRDLVEIRGIGKSRAAALAKARPFKSVDQLANVKGVGKAVYTDLLSHAKSLTMRRSTRQPARNSTPGKSPATSTSKTKSSKSKGK